MTAGELLNLSALLALGSCITPSLDVPLASSRPTARERAVFHVDWRAQLVSDLVADPPLQIQQLRWEPQSPSHLWW